MTTTENLEDIADSHELWETHIQHLQDDRGITDLWPPQVQAFDEGATDDANFLMISPPGTGKTLVAELISVNEWVSSGNPVVYLVPYVALAEEKYDEFDQNLGDEMGLEIEKATETEYPNPADLFESQVIVMTYEKFDYYLRNYPDYVGDISCAVVDEFHMISDETRGPNLEVSITDLMTNHPGVRIVGLSATTPNPEAVSDWLGGSFSYSPDWRHNDLHEGISLAQEREIRFYNDGSQIRTEAVRNHFDGNAKTNAILDFLVSEADREEMGQALVFAPTRNDTKQTATSLANFIDSRKRSQDFGLDREALKTLKESIEAGPDGGKTEGELKNCLDSGIGFHHAGLSRHAKSVLEEGFDQGHIKAVVATSTLAAGVNLPIKRVFVLEPKLGRSEMLVSQYKNLAGRAGRPRLDEPGEAVLFARNENQSIPTVSNYIQGEIDPLQSQIDFEEHYGVLLNLVRKYSSMPDLLEFLNRTYLGHDQSVTHADIGDSVGEAVSDLSRWNMLDLESGEFRLSQLGTATSKQLVSPQSIHLVIDYLQTADEIDIQDLLVTIATAPEFDLGYRLFMSGNRYWEQRDEIRETLGLTHIETDKFDNVITTALVIYDWTNEQELPTIYDERTVNDDYWGTADVRERIAPIFVRILTSVAEVLEEARPDFHAEYGEELTQLAQRIDYGLSEEGVPFATYSIERNRRRVIDLRTRVGIDSPDELLDTPMQELATSMKGRRALRYKRRAVNRLLDGVEQDRDAVLLDVYEQGLNAETFRQLLSTWELEFQNCVINELERVSSIEVNEVDESGPGYDPEAYCYIYTGDGSYVQTYAGEPFEIALECKSKVELDGTVGTDDATEVLKKARDSSDALVTVGAPDFTDEATDAALETGVLLLDAPAFAAAMVRMQQGELDPEQIREFFTQQGHLSRTDVYDFGE